jgi:hypothetical protein
MNKKDIGERLSLFLKINLVIVLIKQQYHTYIIEIIYFKLNLDWYDNEILY